MKYYLIAGEASGDLHASRLMQQLKEGDTEAQFRFFGGDKMLAVDGTCVRHYKQLAYMGFVPVLLHLPQILSGMKICREDIVKWQPDVVILVDYAGFNLAIARFLGKYNHQPGHRKIPVYYYISPKLWAWKEWRVKTIRRNVDELFSILPFEKDFYQKKHRYPIYYVGNPTKEEVDSFKASYSESAEAFRERNGLSSKPILALLAGSRKQEIKDNLPAMLEASARFKDYQVVLACAPSVDDAYYDRVLQGAEVSRVRGLTYELLSHSALALVTSGTATLETALFGVPQVVCYRVPMPKFMRFGFNHFIHVKYISLVNLIAGREVVPELFADRFSVYEITNQLYRILPGTPQREKMLEGYRLVAQQLGTKVAPRQAAHIMLDLLSRPRQTAAADKPTNTGEDAVQN